MKNYIDIKDNKLLFGDSKNPEKRIMGIEVNKDTVKFVELCDAHFSTEMSADEAIIVLGKMIGFIANNRETGTVNGIKVKFLSHDTGNLRIYYRGIDERNGRLYCVQDGEWYLCSNDGEPETPLREGLKIQISGSIGIVGNDVVKRKV